eukprot:278344-Alexandrium_andersonii.AAC.1
MCIRDSFAPAGRLCSVGVVLLGGATISLAIREPPFEAGMGSLGELEATQLGRLQRRAAQAARGGSRLRAGLAGRLRR